MSKRIGFSILIFILALSLCAQAFAISGSTEYNCEAEYVETGVATFLLDSNGRIAGVLDIDSPDPDRFSEAEEKGLEVLAEKIGEKVDFTGLRG